MAELVKPWNDGGSLSVAYEGDGDGSAVFSSDAYEGIDREQIVVFRDGGKSVAVERVVRQEGTRQPFRLAGGGIFRIAGGGRFGVLKEGGVVPPTPVETYEKIESVTFNADKIFEACIIKSNYSIEVEWQKASASGSQYMYGLITSPHRATVTAYIGAAASWRWGRKAASFSTNNTNRHSAIVTNGKITIDSTTKTFDAQSFETADTLIVGGVRAANGTVAAQYGGVIYSFRIKDGDSYILDWEPRKRLSDGVEGFWDCVTQTFIEPL